MPLPVQKLLQGIRCQWQTCSHQPLRFLAILIIDRQAGIRDHLIHLVLQFLRYGFLLYFRTAVLCHIQVPDLRLQSIIYKIPDLAFLGLLQRRCQLPGGF